MKIRIIFAMTVSLLMLTTSSYANWLEDIFKSQLRMEGLQSGILNEQGQMLDVQRDILSSQKQIEDLTKQVNSHLIGHSGWGNYQNHDYQSYGNSARDWSSVMRMAERGQGDGALGQAIGGIANQFPVDRAAYNRGVTDASSQQYYVLKSQTVLAARAASQLDYDKIQDQIVYQQMLKQQIEKTSDLKAAADLSNRIQVEGNLINLEVLRQTALVSQQQAMTDQATVNAALANAKFLTKK